jgi:hypothetical protein
MAQAAGRALSAESQIGQQGQTGSSLNWTYDY